MIIKYLFCYFLLIFHDLSIFIHNLLLERKIIRSDAKLNKYFAAYIIRR